MKSPLAIFHHLKDNLPQLAFVGIVLLYIVSKIIGFSALPYPNRDEVGIAYSAYSIAETGRDEWGVNWPIVFKSIGDYKSSVLIYLSAIFSLIFGPQLIATRAIIFASSLLALWPLSQLIKLFLPKLKSYYLWVAPTLFLPFYYHFSRSGYEAFLAMVLNLFILYFLLKKGLTWWLGLLLTLSILTYSSSLVMIPLVLILYLEINARSLFHSAWRVKLAVFISLGFVGLALAAGFSITTNKKQVTVFSDPTIQTEYRETRTKIASQNPVLARIWYNRPVYLSRVVAANYLKTASPDFIFFSGGNHPWHKTGFSGHLFPVFLVISALGLYYVLFRSSLNRSQKLLLVGWLLITLVPSSITIDAPHATRSLNFFVLLSLLGLTGLAWLSHWYKAISYLFLASLAVYITLYQFDYHTVYVQDSPDGLPQGLISTIQSLKLKHPNSIVYLDQPDDSWYLYFALYFPISPARFQSSVNWSEPSVVGLQYASKVANIRSMYPNDIIQTIQPQEYVITTKPEVYPNLKTVWQAPPPHSNFFLLTPP